ncbi:MAG: hypothetical protein WCO45_13515 [Pseudanabaena sp. ELA607]|jgi:hypothetical protein
MPIYSESGLTINLPNQDYFRVSDCPTWRKKLNTLSLKKMDFGWWDETTNQIYFLEVKDFTQLDHPKSKKPKKSQDFIKDFVTKATDTLFLLAGVWLSSSKGESMKNELFATCPNFPTSLSKIKLLFVVKTTDPSAGIWIADLNNEIRNQLRGRVILFDLNPDDVILIDHQTAIRKGVPIS